MNTRRNQPKNKLKKCSIDLVKIEDDSKLVRWIKDNLKCDDFNNLTNTVGSCRPGASSTKRKAVVQKDKLEVTSSNSEKTSHTTNVEPHNTDVSKAKIESTTGVTKPLNTNKKSANGCVSSITGTSFDYSKGSNKGIAEGTAISKIKETRSVKRLSVQNGVKYKRNKSSSEEGSEESGPKVSHLSAENISLLNKETAVEVPSNECACVISSVPEPVCEMRTIYDLMSYISLSLPSWSLHILPDTNTFCIGQLIRNNGVPYLSKCIELDDHFNAKVYIYEEYYSKFDGVYDNEDTLEALIHEVNGY